MKRCERCNILLEINIPTVIFAKDYRTGEITTTQEYLCNGCLAVLKADYDRQRLAHSNFLTEENKRKEKSDLSDFYKKNRRTRFVE